MLGRLWKLSVNQDSHHRMRRKLTGLCWIMIAILTSVALSACMPRASAETQKNPYFRPVSRYSYSGLYFADDQAMEVLPERRKWRYLPTLARGRQLKS